MTSMRLAIKLWFPGVLEGFVLFRPDIGSIEYGGRILVVTAVIDFAYWEHCSKVEFSEAPLA